MTEKIFLSTSNHAGSVYMIRDFQGRGFTVLAGDSNPDAIGRFFADGFHPLPKQDAPLYWDRVKEIVESEGIDFYVPSGEYECLQAARLRSWFSERGCVVVASDEFTIWIALSKLRLYNCMNAIGVKVPKWWGVWCEEDYEAGLRVLGGSLCIKPAIGSGTRGFVVLRDLRMSDILGRGGYMVLPPDVYGMALRQRPFPPLVLMEYVGGPLFDSNVVCKDGEILWQSVKTREEAVRGAITKGKVVRNECIEDTNRHIVGALGTTGLIGIQYAGDTVLEINPRWSTSLHHGDVNEYLMSMQLWAGEKVDIPGADDYVGLEMIRYWDILTYKGV